MNFFKKIVLLFLIAVSSFSCRSSEVVLDGLTFEEQLNVLFPNAEISSVKVDDHFLEAYQVILKQPLDHNNLKAGTFNHYVYVSHANYSKPTVLITEGYSAKHKTYELSKLLQANQVMVEYRFYGKSRPEPIPWEYLTNDQAVEDYHILIEKLKKLYKGKWISTGISKGGETTLIYKSKYPKDVDVAVPYVAPLINTQEDIRTNHLINSVGTEACRDRIKQFQRTILKHRDEILIALNAYAEKKNMKFTEVTIEEALEYSVLEFPFSFWQWGGHCEDIPEDGATEDVLFNYLIKISGVGLYNDKGIDYYLPSFYQHMKELGYYGFELEPVKDLLKVVNSTSNKRFAPKDVDLTYNPDYIKRVRDYAENKGDHILYIYGANDPWGACAPMPKPNVDALKMVLKGGHHGTRIKDFSNSDRQKIYSKLQEWLGDDVELYPLKN
ncbi:S28 family serine protease [Tamlana sp. 2201CG12-4]|uniref:S28 family serine protease n=1 Tax=Tamlana sp. 2201CG12-4 TaxID=3112582 RepID=UPI002DBB1098|nr:S28 family serine protease [Tamlana sp. 2201CG12-4]MEC3906720.1 S28 family serine protease [Tamlana sp. 2201CG12-4]